MTEMNRTMGKGGTGTLTEAPSIVNVRPGQGPTDGGTKVTITGNNFQRNCRVTFGGTDAEVTNVISSKIECVSPPHRAGMVDVVVVNPDGKKSVPPGKFEYV